jgi:hypothetical protein
MEESVMDYEQLEATLVRERQWSLALGMKYILSVAEEDYPMLLEICINMGFDCYIGYVKARVEQIQRIGEMQW